MSNYISADPDVRISDTIDAGNTAADGLAASPAAVASMVSTINCIPNVKVANSGDALIDLRSTITGKVAQFYFHIICAAPCPCGKKGKSETNRNL